MVEIIGAVPTTIDYLVLNITNYIEYLLEYYFEFQV